VNFYFTHCRYKIWSAAACGSFGISRTIKYNGFLLRILHSPIPHRAFWLRGNFLTKNPFLITVCEISVARIHSSSWFVKYQSCRKRQHSKFCYSRVRYSCAAFAYVVETTKTASNNRVRTITLASSSKTKAAQECMRIKLTQSTVP
jgi:hypothetical protein